MSTTVSTETKPDLLSQFKDRAQYMDRTLDKGIVNDKTGSSLGIKDNGDIVIASNTQAQYRLSHDGQQATEISVQSNTITNRKNIMADEIIVNKHKLNPQLYELTDMTKLNTGAMVGGLTTVATVLVKAWEPNLKKYVLIRRQVRVPLFSNMLNVADSPSKLGVDTDIAAELRTIGGSQ